MEITSMKIAQPGEMFAFTEESQRWLFIGPTRSGKTWSLAHALLNWVPPHDEYVVICPTWKAQPIYYYLMEQLGADMHEEYNQRLIEALVYKQKMRTKWGVDKTICIILDDVLASKGVKGADSTGVLEQIYALGRHHKLSCFTLLQKITSVSTTVRNNASFVMFRCDNDFEIRTLFTHCGFGNGFVFRRELFRLWREPRRPFIYRIVDHTFYDGWDKKLDVQRQGAPQWDEPEKNDSISTQMALTQRAESTIDAEHTAETKATAEALKDPFAEFGSPPAVAETEDSEPDL